MSDNTEATMTADEVRQWMASQDGFDDLTGQRVLLVVPDSTRTAPMPLLFSSLLDSIGHRVQALDVIVALGTHPAMSEAAIFEMMGVTTAPVVGSNHTVQFFNHEWDSPEMLTTVGQLTSQETSDFSNGQLSCDVDVQINARISEYDVLLVLGPVFPHEVVGFSGGNKYFFPGISGPDVLNFFHWLGALITNWQIIGVADTPVRRVVDRAAALIPTPRRCITFVVGADGQPHGLFYGSPETAWQEAAQLSAQVHITRVPRPFQTVLSCAPPMYDELWVAGKCMYKLEPVVADDGELIIYAPHLSEISVTHGRLIEQVGYHVRDYFVKQWDQFKDVPWGVLAHSTHVRGGGTFEDGVERPRVRVTLATGLTRETCERIRLGYRDPATINVEDFANREDEGVLLVRKAGERLYRLHD